MKTIIVDIEIGLGYSHRGWCGTDDAIELEVSDEIAVALQALMDAKRVSTEEAVKLTMEGIEDAMSAGYPELESLHGEIIDRCSDAETIYWCMEAYDCIDESLEPFFYQDVEDGLYEPETDEDYDPEDGYEPNSFEACRDNYLAWVRSHTDDAYFMAERIGIDPGACDSDDYDYIIKNVK